MADSEPREGALTEESRKADLRKAGEIRHVARFPLPVNDREGKRPPKNLELVRRRSIFHGILIGQIHKEAALLPGLKAGVSAPSI